MLPLITDEFVTKRQWITDEQMLDIIAIAETLPGAISIEVCIILGYRMNKLKGAIAACLGVIAPSFLIITLVTYLYNSVPTDSAVWNFVRGIRGGVVGLMTNVVIKLCKKSVTDKFTFAMFVLAFLASMFTNIHVVLIIISCGLIGYLYGKFFDKDEKEMVQKWFYLVCFMNSLL